MRIGPRNRQVHGFIAFRSTPYAFAWRCRRCKAKGHHPPQDPLNIRLALFALQKRHMREAPDA